MMPPSTREIMRSVGSKYAVVVGISKKARIVSAKKESEEKEKRLADLVNHTVEELIENKMVLHHVQPVEKSLQSAEIRDENEKEPTVQENVLLEENLSIESDEEE